MCQFSNRKNKKILVFSWKIWNYVIYFSCYNLFKRKVDHFIMGFIENIIEKAKAYTGNKKYYNKRTIESFKWLLGEYFSNVEIVYNIEIKSVNHRYCDVNVRLPRSISCYENEIKKVALENDIDIS